MVTLNTDTQSVKGDTVSIPTFGEAYEQTHYGDISHLRTQDARYRAIEYCDDYLDLPYTKAPHFLDERSYVKDKCAVYDTSQPFTADSGRRAYADRVRHAREHDYYLHPRSINPGRTGLGAKDVAGLIVSIMECDDKSIAAQIAQTDAFEAWAGRTIYSLGVLSGDTRPSARAAVERMHTTTHRITLLPGKSLQLYVAHPAFIDPSTAREIHRHQVALFAADACTANPDRRMRRPSTIATRTTDDGAIEYRVQTTLRASHTPITGDDYLALLRAYAAHRGVDVEREYIGQVASQRGIDGERGGDFDGTLIDGGRLDPSMMVRDADRTRMSLATLAKMIPDGGRVDAFVRDNEGRPTAAIYRNGDWLSIVDFSVLKKWWCNVGDVGVEDTSLHLDGVSASPSEAASGEVAGTAENVSDRESLHAGTNPPLSIYIEKESEVSASLKITTLTHSQLDRGRYLPRRSLSRRLTALRAPKGTGKTELMAWLVECVIASGGSVLALAHLRTLVDSLSARCRLPHYQGHHPLTYQPIDPRDGGTLTITADSLHKIPMLASGGGLTRYSLIIIDEVQQLVRHLYGGTLRGGGSVIAYYRLRDLLAAADRVVIADADLDQLGLHAIRDLMGIDDGEIEIITAKVDQGWRYKVSGSRAVWLDAVAAAWVDRQRLSVPIQSKRMAHVLADLFRDLCPDRKVLLVTRDTITDLKAQAGKGEFARWLNERITDYDALIYTPTIGTGYSIDVQDHFDAIYGLGFGQVGTAQDLCQMLHRVRHPRSPVINVCASPQGHEYPRRYASIKRGLIGLTERTISLSESRNLHTLGSIVARDGKVTFEPRYPEHFALYCRVVAYTRSWGGAMGVSQLSSLYRYAKEHDIACAEWVPDGSLDKMGGKYKAAKQRYLAERAKLIAEAELLDDYIMECDKWEPANREEELSLERTVVDRFYGQSDERTIRNDDEGRHRAVCRRYGRLRMLVECPLALKNMDWMDSRGGSVAHMQHNEARTAITSKLMERFGVDPAALIEAAAAGKDYTWVTPKTDTLRDYLDTRAAALALCDVSIPKDWQRNPRRLFVDLISNYFKAPLTRSQPRGEEGRDTAYTLDGDELAALHRDSNKWVDDKLASVVIDDTPSEELQALLAAL